MPPSLVWMSRALFRELGSTLITQCNASPQATRAKEERCPNDIGVLPGGRLNGIVCQLAPASVLRSTVPFAPTTYAVVGVANVMSERLFGEEYTVFQVFAPSTVRLISPLPVTTRPVVGDRNAILPGWPAPAAPLRASNVLPASFVSRSSPSLSSMKPVPAVRKENDATLLVPVMFVSR